MVLVITQLLILDTDFCASCDGLRKKDIAPDNRTLADDGIATQNGRTGLNGHVVLNGRMPLLVEEFPPT